MMRGFVIAAECLLYSWLLIVAFVFLNIERLDCIGYCGGGDEFEIKWKETE